MNRQDRAELDSRLALLDPQERRKLAKRAAALRHHPAVQKTIRPRRTALDDEDGDTVAPTRRGSLSIDEAILRLLREETPIDSPASVPPDGLVVALVKGRAWVRTPTGDRFLVLAPDLLAAQDRTIAVGDAVLISPDRVERVLPRRTRLSRPDPQTGSERVIVANVEVVVIVVSVTAPPLHPRIIDRYLLACERGGVAPVIAANKWDLLADGPPDPDALLDPYRALGIPVIPLSTRSGSGLDLLRQVLAGRLVAFVGHSGVGKSSLVNALAPELDLEVGTVAPGRGTGRHTTRGSRLYEIGDGIRVIDTPGIRSLGLLDVSADELTSRFPEFADLVCRFRDCRHEGEPGCGVASAIAAGSVSAERLDTYRRLLASLREEG